MRALAALLLLLAAAPLQAQDDPAADEARAATQAGYAEYELGHFDDALKLFEKAYRLKSVPALLFNIAQCHRMTGRLKEAAVVYRSFLAKDPGNKRADQARELLAQVDEALSKQASAERAPPIEVQGEVHKKPPPVIITKAEPETPPLVEAPKAASTPKPSSSTTAQAAPASRTRVWTWVAAGLAVGAFTGAAILGSKSKSTADELATTLHTRAEVETLQDEQSSNASTANILFAVSGVAAATAGALFVFEF